MKKLSILLGAVVLFLWFSSCEREQQVSTPVTPQTSLEEIVMEPNPYPPVDAPAPVTSVKAVSTSPGKGLIPVAAVPATLTPAELIATLKPGDCITEHKTLILPKDVTPPKGDILFTMDLTGSMWQELANVKTNSVAIMNAVRTLIPDSYFGVVSHMDYPGRYSACNYSSQYGSGGAPYFDYPYKLGQAITGNTPAVVSAINALPQGAGADGPESYTRVFFETYSDPNLAWRSGAKKIVLAWLDAIPHGCNYRLDCGGYGSTGPDPGRDEIAGTSDDLDLGNVLATMAASNITLIALFSGGTGLLPLWDCYAHKTGGDAFLINYDGTVPGGTDIGAFVASLIKEEVKRIDMMKLQVGTPGFEGWVTSITPPFYDKIYLDKDYTLEFDVQICVPPGTPDGVYTFDICAVGDGVEYAKQKVTITVRNEIKVAVDVKPTSCPNPLNTNDNGVLPVAILGTPTFDISTVDPATVNILGVAPIRWAVEDVAAPYLPFVGKLNCNECTTLGPDGFKDLTFKFDAAAIVKALGPVVDNQCIVLPIRGKTLDGVRIVGEDVVLIKKKK